ncbi:diaminobutyrate acetyltransferase [Microbulbifer yueqingensis]|uniref:L-2,4-diaminobutyric acid acetyltransferase n=1 Tax=Microbulbifer yueqingensis TaxID=658219 RepID=A0A1G8XWJ9_9GAMM|nr:diaminobutyrate acetyltransferase [Microbulbifer yueqingensis]SDJ94883.1 diaminobutyrate acetyltransferase [Microbulbifer yueqingensis]
MSAKSVAKTQGGGSEGKTGESPEDKVKARQGSAKREALLRRPVSEDGADVHRLIKRCPPLDENSVYCNLLQASHFADTSVAAEVDGELAGFVSGYLIPSRPDTLFIWQVAVAEEGRGQGLAGRMIREILARPACAEVRYLETTITPDNEASWALFRGLARKLGTECNESIMFDRERHFKGQHDSEMLLRIGPFTQAGSGA